MSKVIVTNKLPQKLKEGEAVIEMPDFMEQVKECEKMLGRTTLTSINNLRSVISAIGLKYDQDFSPLLNVNLSKFVGREYKSLGAFSDIIVEILNKQYPKMFDKYIEYNIKKRNNNVQTIYFNGPEEKLDIFKEFGFVVGQSNKKVTTKQEDDV